MLRAIINAIRDRQYLAFSYDGYLRIVQPAAVGVSIAGQAVLRCYQTQGGHVTPGHQWNLCKLSKILDLRVTGDQFTGVPPQYRRGDKGMANIYAEL